MKKIMFALILPLVVVGGFVLANREVKNEASTKLTAKHPSVAERKAVFEKMGSVPRR